MQDLERKEIVIKFQNEIDGLKRRLHNKENSWSPVTIWQGEALVF